MSRELPTAVNPAHGRILEEVISGLTALYTYYHGAARTKMLLTALLEVTPVGEEIIEQGQRIQEIKRRLTEIRGREAEPTNEELDEIEADEPNDDETTH